MTITILYSLAAGCALLLSFVLGVIVTDRIYQRVYDRSEEREAPSPLSGTGNRVPGAMTGEDAEPSTAAGLTEEEKRLYEEERKAFDQCIHSDAVGYSGDVVEGRIIYDCFVLNEKAAGVYYHGGQGVVGMADVRSAATAAGKSTLTVNKNKDASTNKWYYYCAAKMSQLPTVTYGTAIDTSSTGSWYGATELTAVSTEITPSAGQTCFAFVETDSSKKPLYYATEKLHIG